MNTKLHLCKEIRNLSYLLQKSSNKGKMLFQLNWKSASAYVVYFKNNRSLIIDATTTQIPKFKFSSVLYVNKTYVNKNQYSDIDTIKGKYNIKDDYLYPRHIRLKLLKVTF